MNRLLIAVAAAAFLLAACVPSNSNDVAGNAPAPAPTATTPPAVVKATFSKAGNAQIPSEINIPSSVGEVMFLHELHIKERGIKCVDCHHQINAKKLETPHPDYLTASSVNCKTCHNGAGKNEHVVYTCSGCHHASPVGVADETLSAKVVVHKQCWNCHPVATGKDASASCEKCHSGKKTL